MKGKVKITKISEDDNLITGEVAGTPLQMWNLKYMMILEKPSRYTYYKNRWNAISKDLVVGKYIVKEKETGEYYEINENDFEVEITKNGEVVGLTISNTYWPLRQRLAITGLSCRWYLLSCLSWPLYPWYCHLAYWYFQLWFHDTFDIEILSFLPLLYRLRY